MARSFAVLRGVWRFGPISKRCSMRFYRGSFPSGSDLADTTGAGPFGQWFAGVGLAALLGVHGVFCLITGRALFPSGRPLRLVEYQDFCARAIATVYLSTALFMHLHWFWTASPRFWGYAQLGKMISAIGIIAGFLLFLYGVVVIS